MVHSHSGVYGALNAIAGPDLVKGFLNVEVRTGCDPNLEQINIIARVPMLVVAVDHEWNSEEQCRKALPPSTPPAAGRHS